MARRAEAMDHRSMSYEATPPPHSTAWIAQVWIAFGVSTGAAALGLAYLPVDPWTRAFLAVSFLMAVSSSISLSKTLRDVHEANRLINRVDEAKVNRLLSEQPTVTL
jgi:hypothetical protein